jgi:hypothetical protein
LSGSRVTRWVCEKSPKIFFSKNVCTTFYRGKKVAKDLGYLCNFHKTAQSKVWPNRRKFAQPGHPGLAGQSEKIWPLLKKRRVRHLSLGLPDGGLFLDQNSKFG